MREPFQLMAKPVSFHCNLACEYCFYLPRGDNAWQGKSANLPMSESVLRTFIQRYIAASPGPDIHFTWQGGEPTLAGLAFYHQVITLQKHYAGDKRIHNSLQTNGVLLTDAWVDFLAEHQFLVGVSVDGPQTMHDCYRHNNAGRSVFRQVIDGVRRLQRANVPFNILCTLNQANTGDPLSVWRFLTRDLNATFIQFIPVAEPAPAPRWRGDILPVSKPVTTHWSVTGAAFGYFLNTVFDAWVRTDVGRVFVQHFDNTLAAWCGRTPDLCVMQKQCSAALVIEQNGDIYSCDHFVSPPHRLGNILHDDPGRLAASKQQQRFSRVKTPTAQLCQQCQYRFACQGGCPKHRLLPDGRTYRNVLCDGYYAFFEHTAPYMKYMKQLLSMGKPAADVMAQAPFIAAQQG